MEAAGYTEGVFRMGVDVALVGVGLPALQEVDISPEMPTCFARKGVEGDLFCLKRRGRVFEKWGACGPAGHVVTIL